MATRVTRRGRGFGRGGTFGGNAGRRPTADQQPDTEEAPEIAALRSKYGTEQLPLVKAIFSDWTDEDLLVALSEAGGQVELAVSRIAEGHATQWGSVRSNKKPVKKDPVPSSSSAATPAPTTTPAAAASTTAITTEDTTAAATHPPARGGFRGRGRGEPSRGGRGGRGGFRGGVARGGARGGAAAQVNGHATAAPESAAPASAPAPAPKPAPIQSAWVNAVTGGGKAKLAPAKAPEPEPAQSPVASGWETTSRDAVEEEPKSVPIAAASNTEATGVSEVTVTEVSTTVVDQEPVVTVTEVTETITESAPATNGAAGETPAAPVVVKPKSVVRPGTSWASLLRKPIAAPAPPKAEPAPEPKIEIPAPSTAEVTATEAEPLLAATEETISVPAASQDPWASTPAAASVEQEPSALPVGQGWADAVIAQDASSNTQESQEAFAQHQRAEDAVPALGVDPAGPLDVHTPAVESQNGQQSGFGQQDQSDKLVGPPGLSKRSVSSRTKQDQAVVMPGSTPEVDRAAVQFGSLNLFGSASEPEQPVQQQQQTRALYETPSVLEDSSAQQQQSVLGEQASQQASTYQTGALPPASTADHQSQFGGFQQASQSLPPPSSQQAQSIYGQNRFQDYTSASQQQSSYANRYPQVQAPFGQQQQSQQHQAQPDPFASLTNNASISSPYSQQQLGGVGTLGQDSISPYLSSQQQAQPSAQQQQQSAPSPIPASTRDVGAGAPQASAGPASTYGGFSSGINHQQPSGYPNDYASLYGLQQQQHDPMRNLGGFYNQYDQHSQRNGSSVDDLSSKLGSGLNSNQSNQGQQQGGQQPQQAHQQGPYPQHNMMPYGYPYYYGMPPNYPQHNSYGGYPSHSPYAPYPGYGAPGGNARQYPGQQGNQQGGYRGMQSQQQGGYGGANSAGSQSSGIPHPTAYGNAAYGSFDNSRLGGVNQSQGAVGQGSQDSRNASSKDVFGDRFFGGNY